MTYFLLYANRIIIYEFLSDWVSKFNIVSLRFFPVKRSQLWFIHIWGLWIILFFVHLSSGWPCRLPPIFLIETTVWIAFCMNWIIPAPEKKQKTWVVCWNTDTWVLPLEFYLIDLGLSLKFCISNEFSDEADAMWPKDYTFRTTAPGDRLRSGASGL